MSKNPKLDRVLSRVDADRRGAIGKILTGAAIYATPVVASFSLNTLGGVAQAQVSNQPVTPVPAVSPASLAGVASLIGIAGAFLARGRKSKDSSES